MATLCFEHGVADINNYIYAIGGRMIACEVYDWDFNMWRNIFPMAHWSKCVSVGVVKGL